MYNDAAVAAGGFGLTLVKVKGKSAALEAVSPDSSIYGQDRTPGPIGVRLFTANFDCC